VTVVATAAVLITSTLRAKTASGGLEFRAHGAAALGEAREQEEGLNSAAVAIIRGPASARTPDKEILDGS
jgi:hypothetical protein